MFFFILGLIPHLGEILPDKLCPILLEASASEEQALEAQADRPPEIVEGEVTDQGKEAKRTKGTLVQREIMIDMR